MNPDKKTTKDFNPNSKKYRFRLWVRLRTTNGIQTYIFWSRILIFLIALMVTGWLGLSTAAWIFVKHQRGVSDARFIDIAFYPLRATHYRETMSQHYYASAEALLAKGAWSKAVFNLRLSIAKNSRHKKARLLLADIYQQIQRPDLSVQVIQKGLRFNKDNIDYLKKLFALQRRAKLQQETIDIGTELLPDTPDKEPVHLEIVYNIAQAMLDLDRGKQGKALLTEWGLTNTHRGEFFLADLELAQGFPDVATIRLKRLFRKKSDERVALKLVTIYRQTNQLEDARRIALQRVFKAPNSAGAQLDMIVLLHETDDTEAMEREFTSYLTQFAGDRRALTLMATVVVRFARPDLASRLRDIAPQDDAGYIPLTFHLALMQSECAAGQYTKALETGDIIESYPRLSKVDRANTNIMRAWANYGLGESIQGDSWFKLSLTEDYASMISDSFLLIDRLKEMNQPEAVRQILLALVERSGGNPLPLITLANIDIAAGAWSNVADYLPALFALDPEPTDLLKTISHSAPEDIPLTSELRAKLDLYY